MGQICSIQGCARKHKAKGLCNAHYLQQRAGKPFKPPVLRGSSIEAKFWQKVQKKEPESCWLWTGAKSGGYGFFRNDDGTFKRAHRYSFEIHKGIIPEGLVIDHICHNPACVNPAHLQSVTIKENCENLLGARRVSKSGFQGVVFHPSSNKWRACVKHHGRIRYAGLHGTPEEAALAAKQLRLDLFTNNLKDRV